MNNAKSVKNGLAQESLELEQIAAATSEFSSTAENIAQNTTMVSTQIDSTHKLCGSQHRDATNNRDGKRAGD